MNILYETKAEIVKGTSKNGNTYYAMKVYITKDYSTFTILQNADKELVKNMELNLTTKDSTNV